MNLEHSLRSEIQKAITALFNATIDQVQLQPTNQEFEGSHTLVCFPLTRASKLKPEETAKAIGDYLVQHSGIVTRYNVVKGFLNLVISDRTWAETFASIYANKNYGSLPANGKEIMVEYSSPNTNKPLHLGHLRNNFLGYSVAELYKANGYNVHKVQIINDRGIHICKSMAAWKLYGNGETPQSSGLKGDKLVGKYYVEFDKNYKAQAKELQEKGVSEAEAEKQAPIMKLAVDMLQKWEAKDPGTVQLWKTMNGWVYEGFDATYKRMGVDFEKLYYESDTYLLGKEEVLKGVEKGIFFKKEDGSVWVDLTADGLDQKVLLRSDGTSVYMTQDIGTAILRFRDFPKIEGQIYTVGNEQEYHFKVLFLILGKLGYEWAKKCYHLSYGMVDLPSGKMKSREGTVVDADDLMQEMADEAERQTRELGKIDELSDAESKQLFEMIGLGALKFFLLKVDPKKRMLFDPNESIQLQGFTGPFIQYTHARIRAILRKAESMNIVSTANDLKGLSSLEPSEREALHLLSLFENKIREAAKDYSPAVIANYAYDLAKQYNQFYQNISIFNEADPVKLKFRVALSDSIASAIKKSMNLLGISVPERM
ncbi:MAG TPA: arginine--tRNA ligase [Cyclobacteriaceae bacterium]|nr:arginine--tRNA ligase [Cyclobacteriaceae bacterium]HMV10333.1 arginine--tRNA ligase [Cyclobacteriaceae bacterium]HMV89861.1 arginine--tRNA ligase [Cyclobacteriaceae bacterium]HMX02760.1 arginine--tRNA ligase [Cyclobacteriaceae bacterium]HMX50086.1 arginine--tRNA ligase [Cyclobacteriaceae bacterium]